MTRISYLDGLRGIASVQVVIGHCVLAFAPSISTGNPIFILWDGDIAVFIFFLMSGFVLTYSFEKTPIQVMTSIAKRWVRLSLPLAAAVVTSLVLVTILPEASDQAASVSRSEWLGSASPSDPARALADILGLSMLAGYSNTGLFQCLYTLPWIARETANAPQWSLHIEFWGSLVLIALAYSRHHSKLAYAITLVACLALIGGNALVLFVLGHLFAIFVRTPAYEVLRRMPVVTLAALMTIPSGYFLAYYGDTMPLLWRLGIDLSGPLVSAYSHFDPLKQFSSILIFAALFFLPVVQRLLTRPMFRWLGKLSFSIYLIHWSVMLTIGSSAYKAGGPILATGTVIVITLALAMLFEKWVDRPAIGLSRNLALIAASPRAGQHLRHQRQPPP